MFITKKLFIFIIILLTLPLNIFSEDEYNIEPGTMREKIGELPEGITPEYFNIYENNNEDNSDNIKTKHILIRGEKSLEVYESDGENGNFKLTIYEGSGGETTYLQDNQLGYQTGGNTRVLIADLDEFLPQVTNNDIVDNDAQGLNFINQGETEETNEGTGEENQGETEGGSGGSSSENLDPAVNTIVSEGITSELDTLINTISELSTQNAYLKNQIEGLKSQGASNEELAPLVGELNRNEKALEQIEVLINEKPPSYKLEIAASLLTRGDLDSQEFYNMLSGSCNFKIPFTSFCVSKNQIDAQKVASDAFNDIANKLERSCTLSTQNTFLYCQNKDLWNSQLIREVQNVFGTTNLIDINGNIDCSMANGQNNRENCENIKREYERYIEGNTAVDANYLYTFISAITNPDSSAIKAARLFGFEANYENVPAMLRDPIPSTMCMAKIEGYLDKDIITEGGITKYGCSDEENLDPSCVDILGDLRAQRTQITPDGKTAITYSVYIKNNAPISYIIAAKYSQNGISQKVALTELVNTSASPIWTSLETVEIQINQSKGVVNEQSFELVMVSVYSDSNENYLRLEIPIPLITQGDNLPPEYYNTPTSSPISGNPISSSGSQESTTTEDLLDMV
jgi:hypothetical protein